MTLISLVLALVLEQVRPVPYRHLVELPLDRLSTWLEGRLNAGERGQGMLAWGLAVLLPTILVLLIDRMASWVHPLLSMAFSVFCLYMTMGFRHFSHYFTDIQMALRMGELAHARHLLYQWTGRDAESLGSRDIARLAIEQALIDSYRHVFALSFWYVVLPGPAGVVLYRLAEHFGRRWREDGGSEFAAFGEFARRALALLDWPAVRVTAACFAIVGDFEDAVYCLRTQAARWPEAAFGILIASGAGAMGVRLGLPVERSGEITDRPEIGLGDEADVEFMQSAVGLVWRTLLLILLLLGLVGIAGWVSR